MEQPRPEGTTLVIMVALVPGKYALLVYRGNFSQISSGGALLSKIQISGLAAGIVKIISSSTGRKQPL